ncbi:hypothetical protein BU17DRAFT_46890 [Hysterangium stoloniferum]|nr:hypothetical protein BU17DRAFT_46890 [Hysterangium stoloniferum]
MPTETPLNKVRFVFRTLNTCFFERGNCKQAHQYASNAEEYLSQGLLISAAEEHYKSAEAFLQCVDQTSDEGTKRTLRMLYNEHNKAGKELQKKIAKLTEEGKDPSLPQASPTHLRERNLDYQPSQNASASYFPPRSRLGDSSYPIDESYMTILNLNGMKSESQDTFTQFWRNLEGMLDNLSQPVAFATAPLARLSSEDRLRRSNNLNRDNAGGTGDAIRSSHSQCHCYYRVSADRLSSTVTALSDPYDSEEVTADEGSSTDEAFFIVPSAGSTSLSTKLRKENESLKLQLVALQRRFEIAERMRIEQDEQLRERIEIARREAQRVKSSGFLPPRPSHPSPDLSVLSIPPIPTFPQTIGNRDRESQFTRRVKDLEEEVRTVRLENEKQRAMITKFRERWEKLKESAKRKRNAKLNAGTDNIRDQRIEEEAEADLAAEEGEPGSVNTDS